MIDPVNSTFIHSINYCRSRAWYQFLHAPSTSSPSCQSSPDSGLYTTARREKRSSICDKTFSVKLFQQTVNNRFTVPSMRYPMRYYFTFLSVILLKKMIPHETPICRLAVGRVPAVPPHTHIHTLKRELF